MASYERINAHVSHLTRRPETFFVEFSRAGSVGNLVVPLERAEAESLRDELDATLAGSFEEVPDAN